VILALQSPPRLPVASLVRSSREVARAIDAEVGRDVQVYCVNRYDQPLPSTSRAGRSRSFRGELEFGIPEQPQRRSAARDLFDVWRATEEQAVAVLCLPDYRKMIDAQVPMRVIHEDPARRVVRR
jgi:hypothetical protein